MTMRNYLATHGQLALSANVRESAINVEQTLDTALLVDIANTINIEARRESNAGEMNGKEEPDMFYDLGGLSGVKFDFKRAMPQHFGCFLGYGLGTVASVPLGTGYRHTLTPILFWLDEARCNPSFTAGMRYGNEVMKRLFASLFVDQFVATFNMDEWVKCSATIKGTGKVTNNYYSEIVEAAYNAISLTLGGTNAVQGADAATRLANLQRARVLVPNLGYYLDSIITVVTGAAPAVLTRTAPAVLLTAIDISFVSTGKHIQSVTTDFTDYNIAEDDSIVVAGCDNAGTFTVVSVAAHDIVVTEAITDEIAGDTVTVALATLTDHVIDYIPTESGWQTFPARIDETPMRVSQLAVNIGGKWDNTAKAIQGGHALSAEINSLEYSLNNNLKVQFTVGAGTAGYANRAIRDGRAQTLKLSREFRDIIYQQHIDLNDYFVIHLKAEGAEWETGHKYSVELVFPRVSVKAAPIGVDGRRLKEDLDIEILEDDTLGSVICYVQNLQSKYAAAA